jgi:hypothetical protein
MSVPTKKTTGSGGAGNRNTDVDRDPAGFLLVQLIARVDIYSPGDREVV